MNRILAGWVAGGSLMVLAVAGALVASPSNAASPTVEAAIKSLGKIEMDAAKFQSFCKLIHDIDDLPEQDTAKAEELDAQLDALLKSIGSDVYQAWDLGSDLDPQTEDGKAFEAAMDDLEGKCPD